MDHHDYTYSEIRSKSSVCDLIVIASPHWAELAGAGPTHVESGALQFEFEAGDGADHLRNMAAVLLTAADEIDRHEWMS